MKGNKEQDIGIEIAQKLKSIRANFTRSNTILRDLESYYRKFDKLRGRMQDKQNGLAASLATSTSRKTEINNLATEAQKKLSELEGIVSDSEHQVEDLARQYAGFRDLAAQVFDPDNGLQALFDTAKDLNRRIAQYDATLAETVSKGGQHFEKLDELSASAKTSFDDFGKLLEAINDADTGMEAQLKKASDNAAETAGIKLKAEGELVSVISLKERSEELAKEALGAKEATDKLHKESTILTNDIRNNLGLSSSESLSESFRNRTNALNSSLKWWAGAVAVSVLLLICAVTFIFWVMFIKDGGSAGAIDRINQGPTIGAILAKTLFTSPLIFAVFFSASNYSHVRDLRDKYAFKETVSKSFQAYVKLLRAEFESDESDIDKLNKYKEARRAFAHEKMDMIYREPSSQAKRKKYNIGINRVFQVTLEDEDLSHVGEKVVEAVAGTAEEKLKKDVKKPK